MLCTNMIAIYLFKGRFKVDRTQHTDICDTHRIVSHFNFFFMSGGKSQTQITVQKLTSQVVTRYKRTVLYINYNKRVFI